MRGVTVLSAVAKCRTATGSEHVWISDAALATVFRNFTSQQSSRCINTGGKASKSKSKHTASDQDPIDAEAPLEDDKPKKNAPSGGSLDSNPENAEVEIAEGGTESNLKGRASREDDLFSVQGGGFFMGSAGRRRHRFIAGGLALPLNDESRSERSGSSGNKTVQRFERDNKRSNEEKEQWSWMKDLLSSEPGPVEPRPTDPLPSPPDLGQLVSSSLKRWRQGKGLPDSKTVGQQKRSYGTLHQSHWIPRRPVPAKGQLLSVRTLHATRPRLANLQEQTIENLQLVHKSSTQVVIESHKLSDLIDMPTWTAKLVVPEDKRIQITPVSTKETIRRKLVNILDDPEARLQDLILIYSQVDAIYGINSLHAPHELIAKMYDRFLLSGTDQLIWLFHHPSTGLMEDKLFVSGRVSWEEQKRSQEKASLTWHEQQYFEDLWKDPSIGLDFRWDRMKHWSSVRSQKLSSESSSRLPFLPVQRLLTSATEQMKQGEWNKQKEILVDVCIDIYTYYGRIRRMPLAILFTPLVEFMQAWMTHWTSEKFHLRSSPQQKDRRPNSSSQAHKIDEPSATEAQSKVLIRRLQGQAVPYYQLNARAQSIPGLARLVKALPSDYANRLICTLLLTPLGPKSSNDSNIQPWTEKWSLELLVPFAKFCRRKNRLHGDRQYDRPNFGNSLLELQEPWRIYEPLIYCKGHEATIRFLRFSNELEIIAFHLYVWPIVNGPRYFPEKPLVDRVQHIFHELLWRIRDQFSARTGDLGRPFAHAVLALFYLNIPTEIMLNDLMRAVAYLKKPRALLRFLTILLQFDGRSNGDVLFKVAKYPVKKAVDGLQFNRPIQTLRILQHYHNRRRDRFDNIMLDTATKYPDETHRTLRAFLKPAETISIWNPQVQFTRASGKPSKKFLSELAIRYAISDHHTPNVATRRIAFIRRLTRRLGYPIDLKTSRALVAAALIRSSNDLLWKNKFAENPPKVFYYGRHIWAVRTFLKDAGRENSWRTLRFKSQAEADASARDFLERAMAEVWEEIYRWRQMHKKVISEERQVADSEQLSESELGYLEMEKETDLKPAPAASTVDNVS